MDTNHVVHIYIYRFKIIKETEKGFWIDHELGDKKWVNKTARKRYAYPTIDEAVVSFRARRERMIVLSRHKIEYAQLALCIPREKYIECFGTFS